MIDERINDHLQLLNKFLLRLKDISKKNKDEFLNDENLVAAAERIFQLAIESCINIGNRILSIEQMKTAVHPPETYADIFRQLIQIGIFDKQFESQLVKMIRFRNRLVHLYWEIDKEQLYSYLTDNLNDFEIFNKSVVDYLNRNPSV
jgi:uncharacterized protein YutE (UPF0331/DUF86 family)